jgi:hypothetical protein
MTPKKTKKRCFSQRDFQAGRRLATKQKTVSGDDFGRFSRAGETNETQKVLFFLRKMAIPL